MEVSKGYKLHNISTHLLSVLLTVERFIVRIKDIHRGEVSRTNTNYDDGKGVVTSTHDFIDSSLHVIDDSVSDDQQDVVLLVCLGDCLRLGHLIHQVQDRSKVSRSIQIDRVNGFFVGFNYTVDSIDLRVKYVAVQGETVVGSLGVWRHGGTEAEHRDLFV